jgi:hypothetical protein
MQQAGDTSQPLAANLKTTFEDRLDELNGRLERPHSPNSSASGSA